MFKNLKLFLTRLKPLFMVILIAGVFFLPHSGSNNAAFAETHEIINRAEKLIGPGAQTMDKVNILTEFYRNRDYEIIWLEGNELSPLGEKLYSLFTQRRKRGLTLDEYNLNDINGIWLSLRNQDIDEIDPSRLAQLELKLTEGFFEMAADMAAGQLEKNSLERKAIPSDLKVELKELLENIASEQSFYPLLQNIQPQHPHYWNLKEELRTTIEENGDPHKINELIINLERWRWLPRNLGEEHILVNQPSFNLKLFEGNKIIIEMKTVVGMPERPTPDINSRMTHLVLSPRWYIPNSIAVQDHLPEIRENQEYLDQRNFRVYEHDGERYREVDPDEINWDKKNRDNFPYYLWQDAGPANALGRVIFRFPNQKQIYLHDTPDRHLFEEDRRAYSSGCIRLEKPLELTYYLLRDDDNWDEKRIQKKIDNRNETQVNLPTPINIYLTYFTAIPESNREEITYHEDLYERNNNLREALGL